jgi:hypothetical protein
MIEEKPAMPNKIGSIIFPAPYTMNMIPDDSAAVAISRHKTIKHGCTFSQSKKLSKLVPSAFNKRMGDYINSATMSIIFYHR